MYCLLCTPYIRIRVLITRNRLLYAAKKEPRGRRRASFIQHLPPSFPPAQCFLIRIAGPTGEINVDFRNFVFHLESRSRNHHGKTERWAGRGFVTCCKWCVGSATVKNNIREASSHADCAGLRHTYRPRQQTWQVSISFSPGLVFIRAPCSAFFFQ